MNGQNKIVCYIIKDCKVLPVTSTLAYLVHLYAVKRIGVLNMTPYWATFLKQGCLIK